MPEKFLWRDGEFVTASPSFVQSLTPGILKAKGVFETMRVVKGRIEFFSSHLRRLRRGLRVLKFSSPFTSSTIRRQIGQLLKVNGLENARVRVMIWQKGARVHSAMICQPLQPPPARQYSQGFKAMLIHGHRRETPGPIKSLDYGIFRRSFKIARAAGFDEALLLNRKGELVEGSRTNIFFVKNNVIFTPSIKSGCLPGIMRERVLKAARREKLRCITRALKAIDLLAADEAFLTNALIGVMPLTHVDAKPISSGKPGPVTLCLAARRWIKA